MSNLSNRQEQDERETGYQNSGGAYGKDEIPEHVASCSNESTGEQMRAWDDVTDEYEMDADNLFPTWLGPSELTRLADAIKWVVEAEHPPYALCDIVLHIDDNNKPKEYVLEPCVYGGQLLFVNHAGAFLVFDIGPTTQSRDCTRVMACFVSRRLLRNSCLTPEELWSNIGESHWKYLASEWYMTDERFYHWDDHAEAHPDRDEMAIDWRSVARLYFGTRYGERDQDYYSMWRLREASEPDQEHYKEYIDGRVSAMAGSGTGMRESE